MLGALGPSGASAPTTPAASKGIAARPPSSDRAPAAAFARASAPADLTVEEEQVLLRAGEESRRLAHTALREMFDQDAEPESPVAGFEALLAVEPEPPAREPSAFERSRFGRALAATLDFLNAPFRWLPPAYRLGLGLCGVLLLITLVVVILARVLVV